MFSWDIYREIVLLDEDISLLELSFTRIHTGSLAIRDWKGLILVRVDDCRFRRCGLVSWSWRCHNFAMQDEGTKKEPEVRAAAEWDSFVSEFCPGSFKLLLQTNPLGKSMRFHGTDSFLDIR